MPPRPRMPWPRKDARRFVVPLGLILALGFPSGCAAPRPSRPEPTPKTLSALRREILRILDRNHVPGAGIALVAKDHVIWAGGVGESDVALAREATANTMFRVGSISKTFVGLALLKLAEEGKINLDAPLKQVAPEIPFRNPWAASDPVRVADVLEHTAGFDDMHPNGAYNVAGPFDMPLLTVLHRASKSLVCRWPPAERMAYSNEDYGIAGYLIEKITGEPYGKYIHDAILVPLGMNQSGFQLTDAIRGQLAVGYEGNPPKPIPYVHIYLGPAGDFKSSPAEMAPLVRMFLNRGLVDGVPLLSPASIARMETPETSLAARHGLTYGYGIANYSQYLAGFDSHGHDGGIDGFISTYRYFPRLGLGEVVFLNSSSSGAALGEIARLLANYLVRGQSKPEPPSRELSAAQLQKFVGYYERTNPREQMLAFVDHLLGGKRIIYENGALFEMGLLGKPKQLYPVTADQFRLKGEPGASRIFLVNGIGREVYATPGFFGQRTHSLWPVLRLALLVLAFVLMASAWAFALVWVPRKLFGRMRGAPRLAMRWLPLLAMASLAAAYAVLNFTPGWLLGVRNGYTVSFFVLTILFAALSALSLLWSLLALGEPEIKLVVRVHALLVALACCGVASTLGYLGFIGMRFWRV